MASEMKRNLFPEDTRIIEYLAAYSLMFISLFLGLGIILCPPLEMYQRNEFWVVVFANFGMIQFVSLVFYPRLEILRCVMSIVSGSAFLWLSLGLSHHQMMIGDVSMFILGLGNLYAFVINSVQIKTVWAK